MRSYRKKIECLIALACLCFALGACAPKSGTTSVEPVDATLQAELSPDQQLADFLGESVPGITQVFSETSLGPSVRVTAQNGYVSALKEFCREGVASTPRGSTRIAACKDVKTERWKLAPVIFGEGAL